MRKVMLLRMPGSSIATFRRLRMRYDSKDGLELARKLQKAFQEERTVKRGQWV